MELRLESQSELLLATAAGEVSKEEVLRVFKNTIDTARSGGLGRILIDFLAVTGAFSVLDLYDIGKAMAEYCMSKRISPKLAIVGKRPTVTGFGAEAASQNIFRNRTCAAVASRIRIENLQCLIELHGQPDHCGAASLSLCSGPLKARPQHCMRHHPPKRISLLIQKTSGKHQLSALVIPPTMLADRLIILAFHLPEVQLAAGIFCFVMCTRRDLLERQLIDAVSALADVIALRIGVAVNDRLGALEQALAERDRARLALATHVQEHHCTGVEEKG